MSQSAPQQTGGQVFIDESKAKDYLLVGAVIHPRQLAFARKAMRNLILPGQRRLHMFKESDQRKKQIISVIADLEIAITVYQKVGNKRNEINNRNACITALLYDSIRSKRDGLIFEMDQSSEHRDRQHIAATLRMQNLRKDLTYEHRFPSEEPLLAIPDAVAWAWARGGDWRRRVDPLVTVQTVP